MKFGSLFSGIGGMDLGLERAGMQCVWQVEIDEYATRVLAKHWPAVQRFRDVREVGQHNLAPVDLICGGFPCQDISNAGKRAGINGERSGLWTEFARIIRELRPRYVLVENVPALFNRGFSRVLSGLAASGYDAEWSIVSACSLGAPHMRRRLFIMAYANSIDGWKGLRYSSARSEREIQALSGIESARLSWRARMENPSELYRGADGVSFGLERNRGIGNAVVPQVAEWIGRRILETQGL